METAITVLIWVIVAAVGLSILAWILSAVVGIFAFKSISKKIDRDFNDPFFRTGRPKF